MRRFAAASAFALAFALLGTQPAEAQIDARLFRTADMSTLQVCKTKL